MRQNSGTTWILAVLVAMVLPACAGLRHRWNHDEFGFEVQTDFKRWQVNALLDESLAARIRERYCTDAASKIRNLQPRLEWDPRRRCYQLK